MHWKIPDKPLTTAADMLLLFVLSFVLPQVFEGSLATSITSCARELSAIMAKSSLKIKDGNS